MAAPTPASPSTERIPERPLVLLVTFAFMPEGETGGELLVAELADRGIAARWVVWDDPDVDWQAADLIAVRSTWDYHRRAGEFLAWARGVDDRLLNGAATFAWNADKGYLVELAGHVPTVPTRRVEDRSEALRAALAEELARWGAVVVKPVTGAGGVGVCVVETALDDRLIGLTAGPWVVQPLVASIATDGESSVYLFDGEPVVQVDKLPGVDDIRVHGQYGGSTRVVDLESERVEVARAAVAAAGRLLGRRPAYARVDLLRHDGRWCVSELELIEPGLYLDVLPENAARFADLVAGVLAGVVAGR